MPAPIDLREGGHTKPIMMQQFWAWVAQPLEFNKCWEWTGGKNCGYGRYGKKRLSAHRIVYEQLRGPIPNGKQIDHLCRNRGCVNPFHMEPVSLVENVMRGEGITARESRQTHCKNGHPLEGDNLVKYALTHNKRICKICKNTFYRLEAAKKRMEAIRLTIT